VSAIAAAFSDHHGYLWGLSYRMTGVAADADEVVSETFARALARAPSTDRPLKPWLTRVAVNLSQDRLRRRRRRRYHGPWLPSPVSVEALMVPEAAPSPEARVGVAESLSYAFLVALEALTPRQRAVLLLRDVFELSVAEAASVLEMGASNVKVTLHRARKALAAADPGRVYREDTPERAMAALGRLLQCMAAGDIEGARDAFSEDAVVLTDGGGEYSAAGVPVVGLERIMKFFQSLMARTGPDMTMALRELNGVTVVIGAHTPTHPTQAPRWVNLVDVDEAGRVRRFYSVMASGKLTGIPVV